MIEINVNDFKEYGICAIQRAVDECGRLGGGTVTVPAGDWLSGAIHLRSNITLNISGGAAVHFSAEPDDYLPVVFTRWEGTECYNYSPLIYAKDCENIAIKGKGTLNGHGEKWWGWKALQQEAAEELAYSQGNNIPPEKRIYGTKEAALRPQFIQFISCKNILLEDFTITEGPQWTVHPVYCSDMTIRNINILTTGHNTDGINPDSCKNVLIEGCTLSTGDDCIAINAGLNEDGIRAARPCENIEVRNCKMYGGHGGVVIGSAVSGGVKNIYIHDCKISGTMQGIRIKSMRGRGGYIKDVKFHDIEINDLTDGGQAVQINMFYEFSTVMPKTDTPTDCENIEIKNIKGSGAKVGIEIKGLPERKLKNIRLENIDLAAESAFYCADAESVEINNVKVVKNK